MNTTTFQRQVLEYEVMKSSIYIFVRLDRVKILPMRLRVYLVPDVLYSTLHQCPTNDNVTIMCCLFGEQHVVYRVNSPFASGLLLLQEAERCWIQDWSRIPLTILL